MSTIYFGIDLGTSSSSVSYIVDSPRVGKGPFIEPTTIKFPPPPGATVFHNLQRLPSVIYLEKKKDSYKVVTGFQAEEAANGKIAKAFENLFLSVKSDMGTLKVYEDSVHPDILTPVEISAEIIRELIKAAEKETGISPRKSSVVITVPASFTHNQRQDTLKAARLAGLNINEGDLLDEPIAAFVNTACHQKIDAQLDMKSPKNILIFDLGAGTCDISVFEASYEPEFVSSGIGLNIMNKAISNYEKLGGDNIDLHIVQQEILPVFCDKNGIAFDSLPEKVKRELRFRLKSKAKQIKEEICRQIAQGWERKSIKQQWTIDAFPISALSMKTRKITDTTGLESFMELIYPFITDDLESSFKIADDYVTYSFFGPIFNALKKAKISTGDVDAFIFNGGSCHNPVVRATFENYEGFSNARFFDTPDIELSVSKGAALHCYYLHHNKKPIVNPILNDEIGIYTLGLKREKLLEAGTELPFPADGEYLINDSFCVPRDKMSNVGISIYSGEGIIISNLKLALPEDTRKGEPISIGLRLDSNKVMNLKAFMKNSPDIEVYAELNNPWTYRIETAEDVEVNAMWEKVAQLKKERQPVAPNMMIDLANRERLRNNVDGAIEILQRLEDKGVDNDDLNNILSLCYSTRGHYDKALRCSQRAAELNPSNVTLTVNHGSHLLSAGKVEEAIVHLRKAVDINPDNYFPHFWLGYAYREQANEEMAKREFIRSKQLLYLGQYSDNELSLSFLKHIHISLGEYEEADKVTKKLKDLHNSKIFNGSPDRLIAGPESGMWEEADLFNHDKEEL